MLQFEEMFPKLVVIKFLTKKDIELYLGELDDFLSTIKMIRDGKPIRILKPKDAIKDFLQFLSVEYNGPVLMNEEEQKISCDIIFIHGDLYLAGVQVGDMCFIFRDDKELTEACNENLKACLEVRGLAFIVIDVGESYSALENLASLKRIELDLGKNELFEAFKYLVGGVMKKERKLGISFFTITQMICEPLRIEILRLYMFKHFDKGYINPQLFVILQHIWAVTSKILQQGKDVNFELCLYDDEDDKAKYMELYEIFGILKGFKPDLRVFKIEEFYRVVFHIYMHACFEKYTQRVSHIF